MLAFSRTYPFRGRGSYFRQGLVEDAPTTIRGMIASLVAALAIAVTPAPPALVATAGVPVRCVADGAWTTQFPSYVASAMGVYDTQGGVIYLRGVMCDRLELLAGGARPTSIRSQYDFASAVFLLAHEMMHAQGIASDAAADCAAGQRFLSVAGSLGVGPGYAATLADYLVNARIPLRCYPDEG